MRALSGSHQGPQPERLHSEAEYMAAPESIRRKSDSFPLHRGRRPYMALLGQNDQPEFRSVDWGEADLMRTRRLPPLLTHSGY